MTTDEQQTKDALLQPQQSSPPPENSGKQRNFPRQQSDHNHLDNDARPVREKSADSEEKETDLSDDEETELYRTSQHQRHHRSGRPEKRIIEESAYDPYCE